MTYWLIYYEDDEREAEIYTDEDTALTMFDLRSMNWNCTLFKSVKSNF